MPLKLPERTTAKRLVLETPTPCILCDQVFGIPSQIREFEGHLAVKHRFVIGNLHLITDVSEYVKYWKAKFKKHPMEDYTTAVNADVLNEETKEFIPEDKFHMITGGLQEDLELRIQLHMRRLEQVVDIQEQERKETDYKKTCLFCRNVFEGNSSVLLNHMAFFHNFSVGQPNNLVFVHELIDILEDHLSKHICIFCEKTFKTRDVLKEHMRKKAHKKINPKNPKYDRFYIVNYKEFGKNWESSSEAAAAAAADDELSDDDVPNGFNQEGADDDNGQDKTWDDWNGDKSGAVCLFCEAIYTDCNELLSHMTSIHDFDFQHIRNSLKLNFYQQVKLINYLRRQMHLNTCIHCQEKFDSQKLLTLHLAQENHLKLPDDSEHWDQAQFFFPTYENDELLNNLDDLYDKAEEAPVESEDIPEEVKHSILLEQDVLNSVGWGENRLPKGWRKSPATSTTTAINSNKGNGGGTNAEGRQPQKDKKKSKSSSNSGKKTVSP